MLPLDKPPNSKHVAFVQHHHIMRKTTKLAGLLLALTASLASAGGEGWMTDFEAAKKKATSENKDLLLDFTGSDWCPPCKKLTANILGKDEFKKGASAKYILVELDFPKDKSGQSKETQKQNNELRKKYNIKGYPTILLIDVKGLPYGQTGYQAGGPADYLKHLDSLQKNKVNRDQALEKAAKLEGVEKAKALVTAIEGLPEAQLSFYSDLTAEIVKLDPEDQSGFSSKQKLKEARAKLDEEIMTAMRSGQGATVPAKIDKFITDNKLEGDHKNELLTAKLSIEVSNTIQTGDYDKALKMVDTYITENKITGEEKQTVLGLKIRPLMQAKKLEAAGKILDEIIATDPTSETGKFAANFKPNLEKMKEAAAGKKEPNPPHGEPGHVHEGE